MGSLDILIAGCGYVGSALATQMAHPTVRLWGLRRQVAHLPCCVTAVAADLCGADLAARLPDVDFTHVVFCAAPAARSPAAYRATYLDGTRNLLAALRQRQNVPRAWLFTSSTAVYAQQAGEWIDEDSVAQAADFRGATLRAAEAAVAHSGLRHAIVRFGGLYGPGRSALAERVRAGAAAWPAHNAYGNRIHRDDAAGFLAHLLRTGPRHPLYLGVDDAPLDRCTLLRTLCAAAGMPPPPGAPPSGPIGGKRCRNTRLRDSGFVLQYPTGVVGYAALLDAAPGPAAC